MGYIDGQLKTAQLEEVSSASPTPAPRSRVYVDIVDTSNTIPKIHDGTRWVAFEQRKKRKRSFSSGDTLTAVDEIVHADATSAAFTLALPAAAGVTGYEILIKKTDTSFNAVTIDGDSSEQIDGAATRKLQTYGEWVLIRSTGSAWETIDWGYYEGKVAYTPTGSWSTNTTYTGFWWRKGNRINVEVFLALSGAPTAADLTVNLPTGVTLDTTKLLHSSASYGALPGGGTIKDASATKVFRAEITYSSTSAFQGRSFASATTGELVNISATVPVTFASSDHVHLFVTDLPATDGSTAWAS